MQNGKIEVTIGEWWNNIPSVRIENPKRNYNLLTIKLWKYILNILIFGIN